MRTIVAFFANPRTPPQLDLPSLSLAREMRDVMTTFSPLDAIMNPCSTPEKAVDDIVQYRPRVVLFSGHTVRGTILLEDEHTGAAVAPTCDQLHTIFAHSSIRIVLLFACHSSNVLERVLCDHHCGGIGFSTIVDDRAARTFSAGVMTCLQTQMRDYGRFHVESLFRAGIRAWCVCGFHIGDPMENSNFHGVPEVFLKSEGGGFSPFTYAGLR